MDSFNQYDPFGDTESPYRAPRCSGACYVSTNTIRSGILKAGGGSRRKERRGVSTNTIRSGILKGAGASHRRLAPTGFNQYDPFGDTERAIEAREAKFRSVCFNQYDPFGDTESQRSASPAGAWRCFNQYDPFGDTESLNHLRHA